MQSALAFSIDGAKESTQGLVGEYELVEAANRGMALGVDLSAEKFADLSKAAVIVSQRMGTDVTQAIGDLMTGLGRQSPMILDNLGIIVKAESAYETYAKSLGKTKNELTATEKRIAFQTAALKELNRIAGEGSVKANDAAGAWQKLKVAYQDTTDATSRLIANSSTLASVFGGVLNTANAVTIAMERLKTAVASASSAKFVDIPKESGPGAGAPSWLTPSKALLAKPRKGARGGRGGGGREFFGRATTLDETLEGATGGTTPGVDEQFRLADAARQASDQIERQNNLHMATAEALGKASQMVDDHSKKIASLTMDMNNFALGALANFTSGLWAAADAAVSGGENFGKAILKMTKSALLGIAAQATAKALFALGEGFLLKDPSAFAAAKFYGLAASSAGALGLTLGAALGGGGGGGAAAGTVASPGSAIGDTTGTARPSFGTRREREKRTIVVEVYLGDKDNRSAQLFLKRQVAAQLAGGP
jgi:hypothetical protein